MEATTIPPSRANAPVLCDKFGRASVIRTPRCMVRDLMATTTITPEGSKPNPMPPFSEDDKLGPLGTGKRSLLDDEVELRRVLVAEFQAAADAARDAAGTVDAGITDAVHDFRKALRRAR